MAIRAYEKCYLEEAKEHLGICTEYLLEVGQLTPRELSLLYANSRIMRQFERGTPNILSGLSGTELAERLWQERGDSPSLPFAARETGAYSPTYWAGWALAAFQWHWCKSFRWIFARCTMEEIIARYRVYHEMDISHFLDDFKTYLDSVEVETNLRRLRRAAGLSQSQLAARSGIHIRNIQLYEQRVQDINRAAVASIDQLARAIGCTIDDLVE